MATDARRFPCPVCGEAILAIGERCGLCGKYATEQRIRDAEVARKKALLPAAGEEALTLGY